MAGLRWFMPPRGAAGAGSFLWFVWAFLGAVRPVAARERVWKRDDSVFGGLDTP